jgi:TPR repeat protein
VRRLLPVAALACVLGAGTAAAGESAAAPAPGPNPIRDPAAALAASMAAAAAGDTSLARAHLEPVLVAPRLSRAARARAYHLRGLLFYRDGLFVSAGQDYRRALEFEPTLAPARTALAWLHYKGWGVARDVRAAVRLYRLAARQGLDDAQYNLGLILLRGPARRRHADEGVAWLERAARGGRVEAGTLAGRLLADGAEDLGVAPDPERARPLLEAAAGAGDLRAQYELARLVESTDPAGAVHWLETASRGGLARAQRELGRRLLEGGEGIAEDPATALMWLREAAKQGDAHAQSRVGWAYDSGTGVDPDAREARRWYERAARRDEVRAQVNLAQLLAEGRDARPDPRAARYWYERAADRDDPDALTGLAWLLSTTPDAALRDGARAVELARRAVDRAPGPEALDSLAAALAETGRFDDAVAAQERAIAALRDAAAAPARLADYRGRLDAYRDGRPWRAP